MNNNSRIKKARELGRRFQPGTTGNPGGRPKFSKLSQALRYRLASVVPGTNETHADAFARVLCDAGLRGDRGAIEFIATRCEGYPQQFVELEDKSPEVADEDLTARIVELLRTARLRALEDARKRGDIKRVQRLEAIDRLAAENEQPLLPPAPTES